MAAYPMWLRCISASLPTVFFPTVVATDRDTGAQSLGFDAFKPGVRSRCNIAYPIRPTVNVDKVRYTLSVLIFSKYNMMWRIF